MPRSDLRAVWGLGWKQEQVQSWPYYHRSDNVGYHETRAFGHLEWRPSPRWTANAGLFAGQHSRVGDYLAPRLMLNHHITPDQTLRFGVNRSVRSNSLLELAGDVHYYPPAGELAGRGYLGGGDIRPEELLSHEISYLGSFRPWHLTVDLRALGTWDKLQALLAAFRPGATPLRLVYGVPGQPVLLALECLDPAKPEARLRITRHAPADEGAAAYAALGCTFRFSTAKLKPDTVHAHTPAWRAAPAMTGFLG